MARSKDEVGVAEFKATCTKIMPRVARTGRIVRVLKRGRVLVEIHPPSVDEVEPFVGRLQGTATRVGDILSPIDDEWSVNAG